MTEQPGAVHPPTALTARMSVVDVFNVPVAGGQFQPVLRLSNGIIDAVIQLTPDLVTSLTAQLKPFSAAGRLEVVKKMPNG